MADVVAGTVIGRRYRLERELGSGGMGSVWAARDLDGGVDRAVKLMKDQPDDVQGRRRFLREGRAASAVRHPNVVEIVEVIDGDGEPPAIVMELLVGESLRARLDREPVPTLAELADWLACVTSAIGTAHALGVVHRDLKPENIFLAGDAVKVLDFGVAKLTALDGKAMRSTGLTTDAVVGTPAYMAPEQVFAERDIDHRADIWALGIVLYECLSGECPTRGDNIGQVLKHVVSRPFAPLDQLAPELPADLVGVVSAMLARDRDERPGLHDVQAVLERYAGRTALPFKPPIAIAPGIGPTVPLGPRPRARAIGVAPTIHATGSKRRFVIATMIVIALVLGGVATWWRFGRSQSAAPSPLASPTAQLACPILHASGVAEPAGWLGGAAAAIACERARILLGGRSERVIAPAALLDLARSPVDAFPRDPFGQLGARERSLAAAQQRAQAYLDGDVRWADQRFLVTLVLRATDGNVIASSSGDGRALYEAVRAATTGLVRDDAIPRAPVLEPGAAAWARTGEVDAALASLDLTFAFAHNAGQLPDECQRFERSAAQLRDLDAEGRYLCAYTLGRPTPDIRLDASDRDDVGAATRIRIAHSLLQTEHAGDASFIHAMRTREATPRGRSLLAVTESCLIGSTDPATARELAIVAVQADPSNPDGGWCNPWEQLTTLERDTPSAVASVSAMQAWLPWNSYAWLETGYEADSPAALAMLRRAYLLSPFDTQIAGTLAGSLLASGDRAAARGVALALEAGGLPVHEVGSNLLLVRIETSEAHFGAALARARRGAELASGDAGWLRTQRFEIAWRAFELGVLLGRGREVADWMVARFVDPEPSPLDSNFAVVPMRIPAICVHASAPERCFARFRALRPQLPGAITADTDAFLLGAERYAAHDYAGAAAAWRPLLAGNLVLASALPDAMVDTFERAHDPDLAERIDRDDMLRANELSGATLGHVRAARRALTRGDRTRARELAQQVIHAWQFADEAPPALAEMRQLVDQLR